MDQNQQRVVFVGSFAEPGKGRLGGQSYACRALLASPIAQEFQWVLIDSTQKGEDAAGLLVRSWIATLRIVRLLYLLLFGRVSAVLLFVPFLGYSLLEKGLMAVLAKSLGKRVVISLRSEITPRVLQPFSHTVQNFIGYALQHCDAFICQSQRAANDLKQMYPDVAGTICIAPNWIDAARFRPAALSLETFAARPAVVLFVGLLEPAKGIGELISAVAQLHREGLAIKLVVCGAGALREALDRRIHDEQLSSVVELRGWSDREAILRALHQATVFCLPSHSEGLPNAVLEAMAAGRPIVATAVGGVPELIDDGSNGLLVAVDDQPQLAAALRRIIQSPELALEMARQNVRRAAESHDIAASWPRIAALIRGNG